MTFSLSDEAGNLTADQARARLHTVIADHDLVSAYWDGLVGHHWKTETVATDDGEQRQIGGMFAPYETRSRTLPGGFVEVITPSALRKSLADGLDIVCRLEHDPRYLLATTESNTLEITDGPTGASYRALLPKTSAGDDAWELVRTRRLNHSSMGFMCPQGGDEFRYVGGVLERRLLSVRLTEASPVSQPGYIETDTAVRHLAAQVEEDPDEILALAAAGELRSVFVRSDLHTTATPTVLPGDVDGELDLHRRRNALRARGAGFDSADSLLDLWRRNCARRYVPAPETRSNP